jgi:hypothetical protein
MRTAMGGIGFKNILYLEKIIEFYEARPDN